MDIFSGVYCNNCNVTTNLLARAFIAVVAVFALPRSTGAAGLGIADAADALALAKPEIIDKTSSVNCPRTKNL